MTHGGGHRHVDRPVRSPGRGGVIGLLHRHPGRARAGSFDGGFLGEGGISYAGPNARARAELAADVVRQRLTRRNGFGGDLRVDLIGLNSLHATARAAGGESDDIRLRVAVRSTQRDDVDFMLWEVESLLCCGPAGGGGYRGQVTPCVVTHSTLIARDLVKPTFEMFVA